MKVSKFLISSITLLVMLVFSMKAYADLELLGQGTSTHGMYNLIYDSDLDITWYDYTNFANTWQNQVDWAGALSVNFGVNLYDDWRLPSTVDGIYIWGVDGTTTAGYNITSSEMGHLFYTELGNIGYYDTSGKATYCYGVSCLINTGDFQNLGHGVYWSGTEYSYNPSEAWSFYPYYGMQGWGNDYNFDKSEINYGIAVMDGRAIVPEPISSILFVTGGTLLGGRRYLKRRKKA